MRNKYEVRGDKVVIFLVRKDGSIIETVIDKCDLDKAQELKGTWNARWSFRVKSFYTQGNIELREKRTSIQLHRLLTNCPIGLQVDHINHDTLNNTRENIRIVTNVINQQNKLMYANNKSGFKGVDWHKSAGKWRAHIRTNNKFMHIGLFTDINQAAKAAYDARMELMPDYIFN